MSGHPAGRTGPPYETPSLGGSIARVFDLSLGEMLWSRRTIFMALVVGAPIVLALVVRLLQAGGDPALRVNGVPVDPIDVFGLVVWLLFVRFIVPVLAVFYGTSLIADEVDDRTITYLFTRPIRRGAVLAGKYLAYLACTLLVVLPSLTIVYFLLVPLGAVAGSFAAFVADLGILAAGLAVYGAVFALMGAVLRRPLIAGLVFAFGWEQIALITPGSLRYFTVAWHLQSLVPHGMPGGGVLSLLQSVFRETPAAATSVAWLLAILVACLWLGMRAVERREYVLEQ